MYGQSSILNDLRRELNSGNMISRLIFINVAVFILLNLIKLGLFLFNADRMAVDMNFNDILGWIMLPTDLSTLLYRPWTFITHMFAHYGLFHILFNMLWLYWFGRILRDFVGNQKILPLYIMGGLTGAVLMILSYNIFPGLQAQAQYAAALGASAGVLAIITAAATLVPDFTVFMLFFGAVRIKYIAMVLILIDLVSISINNTGGHLAHLGGALFGYLYIRQLQVGNDLGLPVVKVEQFFNRIFRRLTPKKGPRMVYKRGTDSKKRDKRGAGYSQDKIDAILDKINESGYDSLSKEEKEMLFRASKEK